jgi:hypothetical protein
VADLRRRGLTNRQIADRLGYSKRTVERAFHRYRITGCGAPVSNPRHIRCDACIAADPRQTPALRKSRGAAISARKQAEAAWQGASVDPDAWEKTIRPALASVGLSAIVGRLGVSKSSAWSWKVGRTTPHPSHWRALADLAGVPLPGAAH